MLLTHLVLGAFALISPASAYPAHATTDPKHESAYPGISSTAGGSSSSSSELQLQPLIALEHSKRSTEAFFESIVPESHPASVGASLAPRDIPTSEKYVEKRGRTSRAPASRGRSSAAPAAIRSSNSLAAKRRKAAVVPKVASVPKVAAVPKRKSPVATVPKGKNPAAAAPSKGAPACSRRGLVKRNVVETSINIDDNAMKNMMAAARRNDNSWRDGDGWAILAVWPPTGTMPLPEHYQLIAGYVKITSTTREEKDACGKVVKRVTTNNRQWRGFAYDIRAQNGKMIFIERGESASPDSWPVKNLMKETGFGSVSYENLGPIKKGFSYEDIVTLGKIIVAENPTYSYLGVNGHNCRTFAQALYKRIS
ncbi:hypothetical protein PspLS_00058 [Pyricularia sp. CBS 133598]|nr:hypothetical protein PspLS_00058 [Pyricularia sp. CBS 133598]